MRYLTTLVIILSIFFQSCSTVTIHPKQSGKLSTEPTFEESKDYYFWGLVGEHRVDVKGICGDKKVLQIQSQGTVSNVIFGILTLGIYSPHTGKIWCGEDVSNDEMRK